VGLSKVHGEERGAQTEVMMLRMQKQLLRLRFVVAIGAQTMSNAVVEEDMVVEILPKL
jgi:hypothetical protein